MLFSTVDHGLPLLGPLPGPCLYPDGLKPRILINQTFRNILGYFGLYHYTSFPWLSRFPAAKPWEQVYARRLFKYLGEGCYYLLVAS